MKISMIFLNNFLSFILGVFLFLTFSSSVYGLTFDLIAPSGMLTRGQEVNFIINVNTEGKRITSTQIGMTYQTEYLQYLSTAPGNTFSSITAETLEAGRLLFTGSSPEGFSGSGTFATVTFKLIASAPGSTELCVLWAPSPSPQPTSPQPTSSQPTSVSPTSPPPRSGSFGNGKKGAILGIGLVLASVTTFLFLNQKKPISHRYSPKTPHKVLHHR